MITCAGVFGATIATFKNSVDRSLEVESVVGLRT